MLNYHFRYSEPEPHPPLVDLLRLVKFPKELEQLLNGFRLDPYASIANTCNQLLPLPLILEYYCDAPLKCELNRVANEVEEDLFEAFNISFDGLRH